MLVGRTTELAHVDEALGSLRPVIIAGPIGVGKTALALEIASRRPGSLILSCAAAAVGLPFGLVAEHASGADVTARLASVIAWLITAPLVVVDDAHFLDGSTATALQVAARHVPVVMTTRAGSPSNDVVTSAWRSGGLRLALEPLGASSVGELLEALLGRKVDTAQRLLALDVSGGLPGVVVDLSRLSEAGSFGGDMSAVTPSHELIERCAAVLGDAERDVLGLLGVVGHLPDHELVRCLGPSATDVAGSLVVVDAGGGVRPLSRMLAAAVSAGLEPQRLIGLLEHLDVDRLDPVARVAVQDARRDEVSHDDLLAGADASARANHPTLARRLLERAEPGASPAHAVAAARVGLLLGDEQMVAMASARAETMALEPAQRGSLASMSAIAAWRRPGSTAETVIEAIDRWDTDPSASMHVAAQRIATLFELGRFEDARHLLTRFDPSNDRSLRMQVFVAESTYRLAIGDTTWVRDQAFTHLAAGLPFGPEAIRPVVSSLLAALIFEFQFDEAERMIQLGEASLGRSNLEQRAMTMAARAALEMNRSRTRLAERLVIDAVAVARAGGLYDVLPMLGALGVHAASSGGHTQRLHEHLALARMPAVGMSGIAQIMQPGIEGLAAAAVGDRKRAISVALVAAQRARTAGLPGAEILQLSAAVRAGATTSLRSQRVVKLRNAIPSPVLRALADRVIATERADPFGLMEVAEFFAMRGNPLEAVECAMQAAAAARQSGRGPYATDCDLRAMEWERSLDGIESPLMRFLRGGASIFQLTRREREMIEFAQQGLSNKDIADRTFTSVRTVEGHLMRAYSKLGVRRREELRTDGGH